MTATVPVTVSPGATSTDATIQQVPITAFDQAMFAFLQNPAIVDQMFWAGFQVGALPRDMISGVVAGQPTGAGLPVLVPADTGLRAVWPDNNSYSEASLDFGVNAKAAHLGVLPYPPSGSGAFYCIFIPDSPTASGMMMTQSGGTLAASVQLTTTEVDLWWVFGSPGARVAFPRSRINEGQPNLLFGCWDYGTDSNGVPNGAGQVALYLNGKTPQVSARAAAGTYHQTSSSLVFFDNSADNDPCEVRVTRWGMLNGSPHHDPRSQTKLIAAIQAFADTYGVVLKD